MSHNARYISHGRITLQNIIPLRKMSRNIGPILAAETKVHEFFNSNNDSNDTNE